MVDFAAKRLLYSLGLKRNLQGIASVAHPQLAVSTYNVVLYLYPTSSILIPQWEVNRKVIK